MRTLIVLALLVVCACMHKNVEHDKIQSQDIIVNTPAKKDTADLSFIMGKFEPKEHADFIKIEAKYADREGLYMQRKAYKAFQEMYAAAAQEGIKFVIRSAARNFEYQKGIWERKWEANKDIVSDELRALKILEYSSMPGSSRHHWGTDIDLNSFENKWFESGEGLQLYEWMQKYASTFGYCQPYTQKDVNRSYGYNEEKWHWSYMPISKELTRQAATHLKDSMISDFDGAQSAPQIEIVKKYVLGINKNCI